MTGSDGHETDEAGRSGESTEEAIIIRADNTAEGIRREYQWLERTFGARGVDWQLVVQVLLHDADRYYDMLRIRLADGTEKEIYFDITTFFGKL
jgi:hypothetical protein